MNIHMYTSNQFIQGLPRISPSHSSHLAGSPNSGDLAGSERLKRSEAAGAVMVWWRIIPRRDAMVVTGDISHGYV